MKIEQILDEQLIACQLTIPSKKALLIKLSQLFATKLADNAQEAPLFDAFIDREKLGSTALGHGVAIPHIRSGLFKTPQLAIITLAKSIDFDAADHRPVDVIFSLIAPNECVDEHLNLLAACSQQLAQVQIRHQLRAADSPQAIINALSQPITSHAEATI